MQRHRPAIDHFRPAPLGRRLAFLICLFLPLGAQAQDDVCATGKDHALSPVQAAKMLDKQQNAASPLSAASIAGDLDLSALAVRVEAAVLPRRDRAWLNENNIGATLHVVPQSIRLGGGVAILGKLHSRMAGNGGKSILVVNGNLDLSKITTCEDLNLEGVVIRGDLMLGEAQLRRGMRLSNALITGDLHLYAIEPSQNILLKDVTVHGQTDLTCWETAGTPVRLQIENSRFNGQFSLGQHSCPNDNPRRLAELVITDSTIESLERADFQGLEVDGTTFMLNTAFHARQTKIQNLDLRAGLTAQNLSFANSVHFDNSEGHVWPFADFSHSRFGSESSDDVTFRGIAVDGEFSLRSVRVQGALQIEESGAQLVDLTGATGKGEIGIESLRADGLRLTRVDLGHVAFRAVTLGTGSSCPAEDWIALDLGDSQFLGLDLQGVTFLDNLNLRNVTLPENDFRFDWGQVGPRLRAADTTLAKVENCAGRSLIRPGIERREEKISALRQIVAALADHGSVYDANDAHFETECLGESTTAECRSFAVSALLPQPVAGAINACGNLRTMDCLWGYGVRPWRVLIWLGLLAAATTALLAVFRPVVVDSPDAARFALQPRKVACVGVQSANPNRGLAGVARWLGYLSISGQSVTMVRIGRACVEASTGSRWWLALWGVRLVGVALIALLVISIANSWPWLYKLLHVIGGFFT